jgi:hypothetical protein
MGKFISFCDDEGNLVNLGGCRQADPRLFRVDPRFFFVVDDDGETYEVDRDRCERYGPFRKVHWLLGAKITWLVYAGGHDQWLTATAKWELREEDEELEELIDATSFLGTFHLLTPEEAAVVFAAFGEAPPEHLKRRIAPPGVARRGRGRPRQNDQIVRFALEQLRLHPQPSYKQIIERYCRVDPCHPILKNLCPADSLRKAVQDALKAQS